MAENDIKFNGKDGLFMVGEVRSITPTKKGTSDMIKILANDTIFTVNTTRRNHQAGKRILMEVRQGQNGSDLFFEVV